MKLPKIPIDYSKAASGDAPFDGAEYLLHFIGGSACSGKYRCGYSDQVCDKVGGFTARGASHAIWPNQKLGESHIRSIYSGGIPTHYTPMPEFEEVKGGEA